MARCMRHGVVALDENGECPECSAAFWAGPGLQRMRDIAQGTVAVAGWDALHMAILARLAPKGDDTSRAEFRS